VLSYSCAQALDLCHESVAIEMKKILVHWCLVEMR
jgi:hypothetical protein